MVARRPPVVDAVVGAMICAASLAGCGAPGAADTLVARQEPSIVTDQEAAATMSLATTDGPAQTISTIDVGDRPGEAQCVALPEHSRGFGSIEDADWSDWIEGVRFAQGTRDLSLQAEGLSRRRLRQRFVPDPQGSPRVVVASDLPAARTYRLVQSIMFESGWDWGGERRQTGKIGFGFGGGTAPTGGVVDPAGFSARLVWRGNLDGTAQLGIYAYNADRPGVFGETNVLADFLAPVGEWIDIIYEIEANSGIDAADGRMRAWVNGRLVLDRGGIAWQTSGSIPVVDRLYYSSFYGGDSSEWSPDRITYAQVRDVCWAAVIDGYSGIDPDSGRIDVPTATELDNLSRVEE